jgi:membrane protease subunit HflC
VKKAAFIPIILLIVLLLVVVLRNSLYTVREGEQVVITQFRQPVRAVTEAGLRLKMPFTQRVNRFQKRLLKWDGYPENIPTKDKKNIFVDVWARWRISNLRTFYTSARTIQGGQKLLDDLVDSAVRDVVAAYDLIEVVRSSTREVSYSIELEEDYRGRAPQITVGREKINQLIRESASRSLRRAGIELVDVRIKRINYVEQVRKSVHEQMISERKRIASLYLSEAKEQEEIILGETQRELEEIKGEAKGRSTEIRGEADAEVIGIYAEGISRSPEFYSFLRRLEAYRNSLGENTTLILTTDSDLLGTLKTLDEE